MAGSLDPEAWQEILRDYFMRMSQILSSRGATIEKFIGDAIQGVFGLHATHEDDALRAARAALEMRAAQDELNVRFAERWGIALKVRTGIHTGEVVAGDPESGQPFAVGDVMNVAARLQQIAEPGQILMSPATYERVKRNVVVEDLGPRELKGKPEPVRAFRLTALTAAAEARRPLTATPLVGREGELRRLRAAFDDAVANRTFAAAVVVGDAGLGKTRLAEELIGSIEPPPRVLWGHASPYDRSNTFAPIVQVVRQALRTSAGDASSDDPADLSRYAQEDDPSLEALEVLLGVSKRAIHERDVYFAIRQVLERAASEEPIIVILDDLQWANDRFLDLVGYLVGWGSGAPVLIVCLARPEMVERDAAVLNVIEGPTLRLQALPAAEAAQLLREAGAANLDPTLAERVIAVTGGNPLFIEEMVDVLDERIPLDDGARLTVPDSIRDLLRARIDSVDERERIALEHASVVGQIFWWQAVSHLAEEEIRAEIDVLLANLRRRALIQPSASDLQSEDAFSFTNALLREVVYNGIPKMARSRAHRAVADWLADRGHGREIELDDVIGFHLEQALSYLQQVGFRGDDLTTVAASAEAHLATAAQRALDRWDLPGAASLFRRALLAADVAGGPSWEHAIDAAEAFSEVGDLKRASEAVEAARRAAAVSNDRRGLAHASVSASWLRIRSDNPAGWSEAARTETERALRVFEETRDPAGLSRAHELLGDVYFNNGSYGPGEKELRAAAEYAGQAELLRAEIRILTYLSAILLWGPTPVQEAIDTSRAILARMSSSRWGRAKVLLVLAGLHAMDGEADEAESTLVESQRMMHELGMAATLATGRQISSLVYSLNGKNEKAISELRLGYEECERTGNLGFLATAATYLARALIEAGDVDEAGTLLERSRELAPDDDEVARAEIDLVEAKLRAAARDPDAAVLSERALETFGRTDELNDRGDALLCHAEVLALLGRREEARSAARAAAELYEMKGVRPSLRRALELAGDERSPRRARPNS